MPILFHCPWPNADEWRTALANRTRDEPVAWTDARAGSADVAAVWNAPPELFLAGPNLGLICSLGAGVDHLLQMQDHLSLKARLTRIVDPRMSQRMAIYGLAAVLRYHRRFDRYAIQQAEGRWEPCEGPDVDRFHVGVLGQGAIGTAIAEAVHQVGFRVTGWARTQKRPPAWPIVAGDDQLQALLPTLDAVILVLPLTPATRGLVNAGFLAQMKPGAVLINQGRGEHIVEPALINALDSGWLAGATLDAFGAEPLPVDNPLWTHPKVLITPHVAGLSNVETGAAVIAAEISRFRRGEPLHHEVRLELGY